MVKSPFVVIQDFVSPLICEEIVDDLNFRYPNVDADNVPLKTVRGHERHGETLFNLFQPHIPSIEQHYNVEHRGTEPMMFEWFAQRCQGEEPHCENSRFVNRRWVKQFDRDFTCILFLSDYQNKIPFDGDFEVFGGKLEFPQYGFGFNPERGTLIVFPSGPNFINGTTPIQVGDLYQVRFHTATAKQYQHEIAKWPGNYVSWFEHIA